MFPVMLSVRGRCCLVVGGGAVASRKIRGLVDEGADVTVVAPEVEPEIDELARGGSVRLELRSYRDGEASGYALVFAATDERAVNERVFHDADSVGVWVNVADDPELCSFHLPAIVRRGDLHIAVASAGEAPFAVRRLRQLLESRIGPSWSRWMEGAARMRSRVLGAGLSPEARERVFDAFFRGSVNERTLEVRTPTDAELERVVESVGDVTDGQTGRDAHDVGFVSLVGAGPGDSGLLTLRGYRRLLAANAVVYDRLAEPALPADLPEKVELYSVGKSPGHHPVPQEGINELLVRLAREGKRVVRFKGGDPFVFGRGGEEAEVLAAAGIPFEVVSGVTAGIAGPGRAGIPVTCREEAVRVTLVTAHESIKGERPHVRWDLLGQDPHATIVGYMGVAALPDVVHKLLASGMDPKTPAAMIERATTASQRHVIATISELPEAAERTGIRPPALFVVGATVEHERRLGWLRRAPLAGRRVVVPMGWTELAEALETAGAEVVETTVPPSPSAEIRIRALPVTDWIAVSADDVTHLAGARSRVDPDPASVLWIGSGDAERRSRELELDGIRRLSGTLLGLDVVEAMRDGSAR